MGVVLAPNRHLEQVLDLVKLVVSGRVRETKQTGHLARPGLFPLLALLGLLGRLDLGRRNGLLAHDVKAAKRVEQPLCLADVGLQFLDGQLSTRLLREGDAEELAVLIAGDEPTLVGVREADPGTLRLRDGVQSGRAETLRDLDRGFSRTLGRDRDREYEEDEEWVHDRRGYQAVQIDAIQRLLFGAP